MRRSCRFHPLPPGFTPACAIRALVPALALALLTAAASPTDASRPAAPGELLIELLDPRGEPLEGPVAEALEIGAGGRTPAVEALEPLDGEWQVVLYFDQLLTGPAQFGSAAYALARQAEVLTQLGPVKILLAGEEISTALPATREPQALAQALEWLRLREAPEGGQLELRRAVVRELELERPDGDEDEADRRLEALGEAAREAIALEAELIRAQRLRLLSWLAEEETEGPRLLVLVSGGFDEDPAVFYRSLLAGSFRAEATRGLSSPEIRPSLEETARALSIYGWITLAFAPDESYVELVAREEGEPEQEGKDRVETTVEGGQLVDKTTVGLDPRKLLKKRREREGAAAAGPKAALLTPLAPLGTMAAATGGEVLTELEALSSALERLPRRLRLRFSWPEVADPSEVRVEWKGRGQARVRARRWVSPFTPEAVAAVRAGRFLLDEGEEGDLELSAEVRGGRELVVALDSEAGLPSGELRVTLAVADGGGTSIIHHRLAASASFTLPLELPAEGEPAVAVLVEELESGRWGGSFATFSDGAARVSLPGRESFLLPAPKVIHLLAPREAMVMGRATLETVVSEARVARVDFYMDGQRVAVSQAPPFSASFDFGRLPETHRIEAVAFGPAGEELGRDRLTINEGLGAFRVRIVRPTFEVAQGRKLLVGPVDVEAEVEMPRGKELDRVEFYWQEELVATRFAPPFAHRLQVSRQDPKGFVRVVGHLRGGQTSEDVLFLNSPGRSERLDVDLVQLYVVVTDRQGRPVKDLGRERFRVLEEGVPQELAAFGDAGDQPLTVGLAIDSSASMFVKLPEVQHAAAGFVRSLESRRDRVFVVGFGSEPRLARDTTSNLGEAVQGLLRLEPDGQTAIWRAVVYSLVQLQGAGGKKALIVYSDGADEDPDFSYRTCLQFARRVGAPIYFILSNDEIYRTGGKSLNVRSFLGRLQKLAAESGGKVYLTRVNENLEEIYAEIEEELRSQYLVGYYVEDLGGSRWRQVDVEVDVPGATARTLAGYFR